MFSIKHPCLPTIARVPDYCKIVRPHFVGFGDLWALCSWAIQHRPIVFGTICGKTGQCRIQKISECLELFDWDHTDLWFYNEHITDHEVRAFKINNRFCTASHIGEYCSTKTKWIGGEKIAYCLTTHTKHNPERFLSTEQQRELICSFPVESFEVKSEWSLKEVVEQLAQVDRFYTIDSGLAHLALSVGVPTYIYWYPGIEKIFPDKNVHYYGEQYEA